MDIPLSFFMDEVKNRFYISTQLKQAWASELMILVEIDRVCRKHNIQYFADWGTMLGAIRHGGFVPWDDDLDLCMTRDQYDRFVNEAAKDLPSGYWIMDFASDKDHWKFVYGVANRIELFGFDEENMTKYHNYPYTANVDIFVMDYLYQNPEDGKRQRDEFIHLMAIAKSVIERTFSSDKLQFYLSEIEEKYGVYIDSEREPREIGIEIYRLIERVMSRVKASESDEVGEADMWALKGRGGYPKSYYEETVRIPFEFTEIPVQFRYNQVMKQHYGNYLEVRKGAGGHDYPCFKSQSDKLKDLLGVDKLPEFQFDEGKLTRTSDERIKIGTGSLKELASECLQQMAEWHEEVRKVIFDDAEYAKKILADCQQLAVDLGTLAERLKGEANPVTRALEQYCESLFQVYGATSRQDQRNSMQLWQEDYNRVEEEVQRTIIDRKSIVFFPIYHERWSGFQILYEKLIQDNSCDIYVVPLPLAKKDSEGRLTEDILYEPEQYPPEVRICFYKEFDIALCYPDEVYIQDVYDNENPLFSIPKEYYSSILRENCKKLIYVPWFEVDEFEKDAVCETFNLSILLKTPGIMNADEIWAQSEMMRQRYIEILADSVGENTRNIWGEKIVSRQLPVSELREKRLQERAGKKKNLLYCIGVNELSENSAVDKMLETVKERFKIFEKAGSDGLCVTVTCYPKDFSLWQHVNKKAAGQMKEIIEEYGERQWCTVDTDSDDRHLVLHCDAYYGEPTPMALMFKDMGKPVMIAREAD